MRVWIRMCMWLRAELRGKERYVLLEFRVMLNRYEHLSLSQRAKGSTYDDVVQVYSKLLQFLLQSFPVFLAQLFSLAILPSRELLLHLLYSARDFLSF